MYLKHISLTNFRLYSRLDMDVPRHILLLEGGNAQGKTSLLEAIYYLATFTSFHAQSDRQLVNFIATREALAVSRLVANFARGEEDHRLEIRLIQDSNGNGGTRQRREVLLDGVKTPPSQAVGYFNAVIFLPQMTRILEGGPEERRRYLNLCIAQADPVYTRALTDYNQALTQRNALLKLLGERGGDQGQLDYWDNLITTRGAVIMHARIKAIRELEQIAKRIHEQLTGGNEVLRLNYQPSYDPIAVPDGQLGLPMQVQLQRENFSVNQLTSGFQDKLRELRREEIARGVTTAGPHRDEMRLQANGIDLSDFGSRGQIRTAILAMKLAEVEWLKQKTGQWPVLLLDEMLAELDTQRRELLLGFLKEVDQVLVTTTDLDLFSPDFVKGCDRWQITGGMVLKP
jgi:DNA replication and repair protein RecF